MIEVTTERLLLRTPRGGDEMIMAEYRIRNKATHAWTEPRRRQDYYTPGYWVNAMNLAETRASRDEEYRFLGFLKATQDSIACLVNFYDVVRGPIQTALLGYSVDESLFGQGIATEAVSAVVSFGFETLDLMRIKAGVLPDNHGSVRVLQKCGFCRVGRMQKSLQVMGEWRDHDLYDQANPAWRGLYQ